MKRAVVVLALAGAAPGIDAAAQTLKDFAVERARRSEDELRLIVDFTAGVLFLRPSTDGSLYRMQLRYDAERYEPIGTWDAARRTVRLGIARQSSGGLRVVNRDQLAQQATIEVTPHADLTLDATLGAAETSLELGGLRLEELSVNTGASVTELRFSRPNPILCRQAQISSGAAELRVRRLGNAGCRRWSIEGGVGQVTLDLDGAWTEPAQVHVRMTVGGIRLEMPEELGVRIRLSRFLSAFSPEGFSRTGSTYTSNNWDRAARRVDLDLTTTLGKIDAVWK